MTATVAAAGRSLRADDFRCRTQPQHGDHDLDRLMREMEAAVSRSLLACGLLPAHVLAERGRADLEQRSPDSNLTIVLTGPSGRLLGRLSLDQAAGFVLCEGMLGGTGAEPAVPAGIRPSSGIERKIGELVLTDISHSVVTALSATLDEPFAAEPTEQDSSALDALRDTTVIARVLVNAYGYSGEVTIELDRKGLLAIFAARAASSALSQHRESAQRMAAHIGEIELELSIRLPDERLALEALRSLGPGNRIVLGAEPSTKVSVYCGGVRSGHGELVRTGDLTAFRFGGWIA
jgi:flagellar motor switch protein FliM